MADSSHRPISLSYSFASRRGVLTLPGSEIANRWSMTRVVTLVLKLDPWVTHIQTIQGGVPTWAYIRKFSGLAPRDGDLYDSTQWSARSIDPYFSTERVTPPEDDPVPEEEEPEPQEEEEPEKEEEPEEAESRKHG